MKSESALDYAVFQLNEAQSRCELWICAGEKNEKLASGSLKPFVAHLRAAKDQLAKGSNFIILQAPPFVGDGSPWFTKRTIERFVRFVSTPDVLEGVSVLEAELSRLDDATNILISDSSWACDPLKSCPVTPRTGSLLLGNDSASEVAKTYTRRPSFDYAGATLLDGSKRDLLKAMETRRIMLAHEQKKAFAHATAAGFNVSVISDLMVFANCFGAPRLWEACLKFMTLCKKKQESTSEEPYFGTPVGSSDSSIQLVSNETSESSDSSISGTSRAKTRKTWDPQVMATLQQLYSRKVENGSLMSPDGKKVSRKEKQMPSSLGDVDLVVGARESVCLLEEQIRSSSFRSKIDDKRISVQDAINLFESKQQKLKQDDASKKKTSKECNDEKPTETAVPEADEHVHEAQVKEPDLEPAKTCSEVLVQCAETAEQVEDASQSFRKMPNALAVVSEATELEELDSIEWKPLSKSSGYIFDDMFLQQKGTVTENSRRQSLCVWKTTWDNEFEPGSDTLKTCGPKGRFYDQYQEKREAKLKHEPMVKRAEKEAKLKAMQDVLERRKAELSTRSTRFSDKSSGTKSSSSRKENSESKSCELTRIGSKRASPVTSAHSTPLASRQDAGLPRTVSARKPSPSSQKSSTATTPRALHESKFMLNRLQRRSAESLYPEQGKENVDPVQYSSDIELPQHLKYPDRKSKPSLATKRNTTDSNQVKREQTTRPDNSVQKRGKQSPQSRLSTASSAVKGPSEASKLQRTRSDVSASSISSDVLLPLKLDGDDAESSCSCPPTGNIDTCTSLPPADSTELVDLQVTLLQVEDQGGAVQEIETSIQNNDTSEVEHGLENKISDVKEDVINSEDVPQMKHEAESEQNPVADMEREVEVKEIPCNNSGTNQAAATDDETVICELPVQAEVEASIDLDVLIEELAKDECEVVDEKAVQVAEVKTVAENDATMKFPSSPAEEHGVSEMPPKATPLFELAELDQKKFPAAYKVDPLPEDISSSTRADSEDQATTSSSSQPTVENDAETACSGTAPLNLSPTMVGSFIPRTMAADGQVQKCTIFPSMLSRKNSQDAVRASSEPGSPNKLPLFDLLVTEQSTQSSNNQETINTTNAVATTTNNNSKALKSSSHKLPHMCRLPSPDTRGSESSNKKLLHKSTASASKLADASSKPSKEPFKGIKKLLRFGRKSSGTNSERIMWQNGWFRGE